VLSKVLYQVFIGSLTAVVILVTGVVLFGVRVRIGWEVPAMVVLAAAVFAGMAMAMSRWVKEEDQANAAGSAVTFPMMFLSGTFFPLASMPVALQAVARVLPLTYVNEGLRAAMITGNGPTLALNLGVTAGLAALAMVAGSLLLEWKEV
jgi:ABC-2 type transport system permease protein